MRYRYQKVAIAPYTFWSSYHCNKRESLEGSLTEDDHNIKIMVIKKLIMNINKIKEIKTGC